MTKTAHYPQPWPSRSSIAIGILLVGLTLCAAGCFPVEFLNLKYTLPTECTAAYSPSIGRDLVIGESSEEVLRKVGKPNEAIKEKGYTYYVYFVQPYLLREIGGKYLGACSSGPYADSSMYYVTFDADKRIESIAYYLPAGAASQQVRVPETDGLMLPATLYSPRGCSAERKPAIVLLHGWLKKGATDTELEWYADLLAEEGYVVLVPLMRGWGGGQNDCGLSQPADIARAIEWLAAQPDVDPNRIGIVGFSFGGQVALLTGALSRRVKAIVSYYAPTDMVKLKEYQGRYWDAWAASCESDPIKPSPVSVAGQIKAPVLLIQGDADTTVPPEQAEEMENALRASGDSVQLYLESGAGHRDSGIPSWSATQQFLEANLGKPSCVQTLHAPIPSARPTLRALQAQ
jgi:dienelactone hydrolase